jgi:copper chaperone NosL
MTNRARALLTVLLLGVTPACRPATPRPILLGAEPCGHCHMTISDPRFTAEAITASGRTIAFDDVGCLAAWLGENSAPIASSWVASFVEPQAWLAADSAVYLRSDSLRTPMGSGLAALRPGHEADSVRAALGGTLLRWGEVLASPTRHGPPTAS